MNTITEPGELNALKPDSVIVLEIHWADGSGPTIHAAKKDHMDGWWTTDGERFTAHDFLAPIGDPGFTKLRAIPVYQPKWTLVE